MNQENGTKWSIIVFAVLPNQIIWKIIKTTCVMICCVMMMYVANMDRNFSVEKFHSACGSMKELFKSHHQMSNHIVKYSSNKNNLYVKKYFERNSQLYQTNEEIGHDYFEL